MGGVAGRYDVLSSALYSYYPTDNTWTSISANYAPTGRGGHKMVAISGYLYVTGGHDCYNTLGGGTTFYAQYKASIYYPQVYRLDPSVGSPGWTTLSITDVTNRAWFGMAVVGSNAYLFGGGNDLVPIQLDMQSKPAILTTLPTLTLTGLRDSSNPSTVPAIRFRQAYAATSNSIFMVKWKWCFSHLISLLISWFVWT
jgi:hypothetical protein